VSSLDPLKQKFPEQVAGLDADNVSNYEGLPNHVGFLREVVLAWGNTKLQNAIHDANKGISVSGKTIANIEKPRGNLGSELTCRRILNGLNKGLSERGLPTVTYGEVFPGGIPGRSRPTTNQTQPASLEASA
jgi:hypothetical protein